LIRGRQSFALSGSDSDIRRQRIPPQKSLIQQHHPEPRRLPGHQLRDLREPLLVFQRRCRRGSDPGHHPEHPKCRDDILRTQGADAGQDLPEEGLHLSDHFVHRSDGGECDRIAVYAIAG